MLCPLSNEPTSNARCLVVRGTPSPVGTARDNSIPRGLIPRGNRPWNARAWATVYTTDLVGIREMPIALSGQESVEWGP